MERRAERVDWGVVVHCAPESQPAAVWELCSRTLTNLYNQRPTWLANLHATLDAAVFAAYGWPPDIGDDEMLERLLALNLERASASAP